MRKKINLLFIITKLELGGAQTHVLNLIQRLDRKYFNPILYTSDEGILLEQALKIDGLTVQRCRFLDRSVHPVKDLLALQAMVRFIKQNHVDVVHTHSSKAGVLGRLAARISGVPLVCHTVHGWSFHAQQSLFFHFLALGWERICARWTDHLIVVSSEDQRIGEEKGIRPRGQYHLIRCGIEWQRYEASASRAAVRKSLGIGEKDVVIGTIACFKPQKAPLDFIRLVSGVKAAQGQVKFLMVGDGRLRRQIEGLVQKRGLQEDVILAGWRDDIPRVLSAMDIFVLTSLWEGLPISVLEAMASGVPVVVTDTGGVRDVVRHGDTGLLVKKADVADMQEKVLAVLKDHGLRARLTERAVQLVRQEEFSLKRTQVHIEELYKKWRAERSSHG